MWRTSIRHLRRTRVREYPTVFHSGIVMTVHTLTICCPSAYSTFRGGCKRGSVHLYSGIRKEAGIRALSCLWNVWRSVHPYFLSYGQRHTLILKGASASLSIWNVSYLQQGTGFLWAKNILKKSHKEGNESCNRVTKRIFRKCPRRCFEEGSCSFGVFYNSNGIFPFWNGAAKALQQALNLKRKLPAIGNWISLAKNI